MRVRYLSMLPSVAHVCVRRTGASFGIGVCALCVRSFGVRTFV